MADTESVKQKIIMATIQCIESCGIQDLTIRKIARAAGVNIAAINYYFGNKKNLLETALHLTMDEAFSEYETALHDDNTDPFEVLKAFLENTLWGSMFSPGVTKAHLFSPIYEKDRDGYAFRRNKDFIKLLVDRLTPKGDARERKKMKYTVVQLIASVVLVGIIPEVFEQATGLDFHKDRTQKEYVASLMAKHFPDK